MLKAELFFDTGRLVDAFSFTRSDLTVVGVARALARINRFAGNGEGFEYVSVAQHCVNLSYLVPDHLRKAALLHDLPEIFIGDVPSPIKRICPRIMEIEEVILRNTAEVFEIPYHHFLEVTPFDSAIGRDEARFLFPDADTNLIAPERGLGIEVITMNTVRAADEWARRFYQLYSMENTYDD